MHSKHLLWLLLMIPLWSSANSTTARIQYIEEFSTFAIEEMRRSGVPASITLAQGILESNAGQSELSRESLNHFGIKCRDWDGATVYYEDDDYDDQGNLIKSCFRSYNSVLESYADHSDFLRNSPRYSSLFDLDPTDYHGWAHGLKACGYATNEQYGHLLVKIIEDYALYVYDFPTIPAIKQVVISATPDYFIHQTEVTPDAMAVMEQPTYFIPEELAYAPVADPSTYREKHRFIKLKATKRKLRRGVSNR